MKRSSLIFSLLAIGVCSSCEHLKTLTYKDTDFDDDGRQKVIDYVDG